MTAIEPARAVGGNALARYFAATRPGFLVVTAAASFVGTAYAGWHGAGLRVLEACVAIVFALVAHAGVNVLNDYFDAVNGSDDANVDRLFPYTGGSRMIQNGVMTRSETFRFAVALLVAVVPAGLWLVARSGSGLLLIGVAGLAVGWLYSAPPIALMARGLGEVGVTAGFLLVIVGCDYVQRGAFAGAVFLVGLPYALLVANVLFINQFPDVRADASAGKRTLVVRLGPRTARWGYLITAFAAYGLFATAIISRLLPMAAVVALLSAPVSAFAARELALHVNAAGQLVPAIRATIAAAIAHAVLLSMALVLSTWGVLS